MTLILLRHGQSQWNLENRFTGFHDVDITAAGENEARKAGEALKSHTIDAVFTSTLLRARRTAQIALTAAGQEHMIAQMSQSDALRERDYGALTGLNKAETALKYGDEQVHIWRRSYDVPPPEGESLKNVVDRVSVYYEHVLKPVIAANTTTLIAAHGNSLRALLIILGEETSESIMKRELATGEPIYIG
jgi:2,3-bisphosphoglycerate-dependent phosphoglycerate mutase